MKSLKEKINEGLLDRENKRVIDSVLGEKLRLLAVEKCGSKNSSAYDSKDCHIIVRQKEANYHHDNDIKGPGYAMWDAMMELGLRRVSGAADHIAMGAGQKIFGIEFDMDLDDYLVFTKGSVYLDRCKFMKDVKFVLNGSDSNLDIHDSVFSGQVCRFYVDPSTGKLDLSGNRYECEHLYLRCENKANTKFNKWLKDLKAGNASLKEFETLIGGKMTNKLNRISLKAGNIYIIVSKDPNWIPSTLEYKAEKVLDNIKPTIINGWSIKAIGSSGSSWVSKL